MDLDALPPLFWELHHGNPREGPGCREATLRALALAGPLPPDPVVLDAGCGPGAQTTVLAEAAEGTVVALDLHLPFLLPMEGASARGRGRIVTVNGDMGRLPFADGVFDLVWAEGAIYLAGFDAGLRLWRRHLKPGGAVAVSEITWLRPDPPPELRLFWEEAYPALRDVAGNLDGMRRAGYGPLGHFTLPEAAWWEYYRPIEARLDGLVERHAGDAEAVRFLETERQEIELYRRFSDYYGYVFYVGRRSE